MNEYPFTILIVDDNPNNLFTLEALLKQVNHCKVIQAESGEAALAATLEHAIDLILLDIQMPGMDGYETAQHLKMTARTRDIPIIFLTAVFKREEFIQRGYQVGAVDYITKPLDDNQLLNRIELYRRLHEREVSLQTALDQLRQSDEESFHALFEGSMDAITITGPDRRLIDCNDRAVELFGYESKQQLIDAHPNAISPTAQPNGHLSAELANAFIQRALTQGKAQFEWEYLKRDGTPFTADILLSFINWKDRPAVQSSLRDITERKQNENELKRYKDHLEEIVQQRTTELIAARDAAEAANKAKSVFLANMSHELRTPLNAILGFSDIIRKDPLLPESQRQNLNIINRSGEHLLYLINDVLEMAKIEAGRTQMEESAFDFQALMQDVTDMMSVRAHGKGLQLITEHFSKFPRYIVGDESRLRQILVNLIDNAIKFTVQGGVTLRLGTKQTQTEQLIIEVEDSGSGITPENQQRIFEPFIQLGEHGINQGSGLGLTITRQFIQLMGGKLILESTPGKGSLFRVQLPLKEASEANLIHSSEQESEEVVSALPGQPEYRILIIEDQLENQMLLAKLMESVNFKVKLADNGKQGVQLFQSWQPHLIWMDRRMPEMDGLKATRAIRQLPGGKDVKIIAVTASAFIDQREEILEAGMDDFICKPYRSKEIYQCLTQQLGVQFEHKSTPKQPACALTSEMLSVLPEELRHELKGALESLECLRIASAIQQTGHYDEALQKALTQIAETYDYSAIINLLSDE